MAGFSKHAAKPDIPAFCTKVIIRLYMFPTLGVTMLKKCSIQHLVFTHAHNFLCASVRLSAVTTCNMDKVYLPELMDIQGFHLFED